MTLTEERYARARKRALREITRTIVHNPNPDEFGVIHLEDVVNWWINKNYDHTFGMFDAAEVADTADVNDDEYLHVTRYRDGLDGGDLIRTIARDTVSQDLYETLRSFDQRIEAAVSIHDTLDAIHDPAGKANPYPSEVVNDVYEWADGRTFHDLSPADEALDVDDSFRRLFNEAHVRRFEPIEVMDFDHSETHLVSTPVIPVLLDYLATKRPESFVECDLRFE